IKALPVQSLSWVNNSSRAQNLFVADLAFATFMNSLRTARRAPLASEGAALMAWPLTTRAICLWPLLAMAEYTRSRRMARGASLPPVRLLLVWPLTAQATSLRRIWMAAIFTDSLRTVYGALLPPDWVTQPVSRSPHAGHHATDGAGH